MQYNIGKKIGGYQPPIEPKKAGCFFWFYTYLIIVSETIRKMQPQNNKGAFSDGFDQDYGDVPDTRRLYSVSRTSQMAGITRMSTV